MKERSDHSVNRPGAWTHSEQGVEEVFSYPPRRKYITEKYGGKLYGEKRNCPADPRSFRVPIHQKS